MKTIEFQKEDSLFPALWEHLENSNTKISKRVYDWLQLDYIGEIVVYYNRYWFEMNSSHRAIPKYVLAYIKKFANQNGLKHNFEK